MEILLEFLIQSLKCLYIELGYNYSLVIYAFLQIFHFFYWN